MSEKKIATIHIYPDDAEAHVVGKLNSVLNMRGLRIEHVPQTDQELSDEKPEVWDIYATEVSPRAEYINEPLREPAASLIKAARAWRKAIGEGNPPGIERARLLENIKESVDWYEKALAERQYRKSVSFGSEMIGRACGITMAMGLASSPVARYLADAAAVKEERENKRRLRAMEAIERTMRRFGGGVVVMALNAQAIAQLACECMRAALDAYTALEFEGNVTIGDATAEPLVTKADLDALDKAIKDGIKLSEDDVRKLEEQIQLRDEEKRQQLAAAIRSHLDLNPNPEWFGTPDTGTPLAELDAMASQVAPVRNWSPTQTDECPVRDTLRGGFMESDEQLRARLKRPLEGDVLPLVAECEHGTASCAGKGEKHSCWTTNQPDGAVQLEINVPMPITPQGYAQGWDKGFQRGRESAAFELRAWQARVAELERYIEERLGNPSEYDVLRDKLAKAEQSRDRKHEQLCNAESQRNDDVRFYEQANDDLREELERVKADRDALAEERDRLNGKLCNTLNERDEWRIEADRLQATLAANDRYLAESQVEARRLKDNLQALADDHEAVNVELHGIKSRGVPKSIYEHKCEELQKLTLGIMSAVGLEVVVGDGDAEIEQLIKRVREIAGLAQRVEGAELAEARKILGVTHSGGDLLEALRNRLQGDSVRIASLTSTIQQANAVAHTQRRALEQDLLNAKRKLEAEQKARAEDATCADAGRAAAKVLDCKPEDVLNTLCERLLPDGPAKIERRMTVHREALEKVINDTLHQEIPGRFLTDTLLRDLVDAVMSEVES